MADWMSERREERMYKNVLDNEEISTAASTRRSATSSRIACFT